MDELQYSMISKELYSENPMSGSRDLSCTNPNIFPKNRRPSVNKIIAIRSRRFRT